MLIERLCPTAEELSVVNAVYNCEQCQFTTKNAARYSAHMVKRHHVLATPSDYAFLTKKKSNVQKLYYCPVDQCKFHDQEQFQGFPKLAALKQHYSWVHSPKQFTCSTCQRRFPRAQQLAYHSKSCSQSCVCAYCDKEFKSMSRRNHHATHCPSQSNGIREKSNVLHSHSPGASVNAAAVVSDVGTNGQLPLLVGGNSSGQMQMLPPIYLPIVPMLPAGSGAVNASDLRDVLVQALLQTLSSSSSSSSSINTSNNNNNIGSRLLSSNFSPHFVASQSCSDPNASSEVQYWCKQPSTTEPLLRFHNGVQTVPSPIIERDEIGVATDLCFGLDDALMNHNMLSAGGFTSSTAIQTDVLFQQNDCFHPECFFTTHEVQHGSFNNVETQTLEPFQQHASMMIGSSLRQPSGLTTPLHACEIESFFNDMETQTGFPGDFNYLTDDL